jgi:hypothetical protein
MAKEKDGYESKDKNQNQALSALITLTLLVSVQTAALLKLVTVDLLFFALFSAGHIKPSFYKLYLGKHENINKYYNQ